MRIGHVRWQARGTKPQWLRSQFFCVLTVVSLQLSTCCILSLKILSHPGEIQMLHLNFQVHVTWHPCFSILHSSSFRCWGRSCSDILGQHWGKLPALHAGSGICNEFHLVNQVPSDFCAVYHIGIFVRYYYFQIKLSSHHRWGQTEILYTLTWK